MTRARFVFVAALVLAAGCSLAPPGTETDRSPGTVTPAPVPGTETAAGTVPLPPGIFADEAPDAARLAEAHADAVADVPHTWTLSHTETQAGTRTTVRRTARRVTVDGDVALVEQSGTALADNGVAYGSGDRWFLRRATDRGAGVAVVENPPGGPVDGAPTALVARYLDVPEVTVEPVRRGGQRFVRVRAPPAEEPRTLTVRGRAVTARNYSVTALVAPSGFVRRFVARYDRRVDGARHEVTVRFGHASVGAGTTNVTPPDWVPDDGDADATGTDVTDRPGSTDDVRARSSSDGQPSSPATGCDPVAGPGGFRARASRGYLIRYDHTLK